MSKWMDRGPGRDGTCRLLGALLACVLALAAGCGNRDSRARNVLLISVDTLRPDRLGFGGQTRPVSPNLDQLAREGVVFSRSYSQSGWTLPSMATIMTGRYPKDHKAVDFHFILDRNLPTLAGLLKDRGYDTRGFVSHILLTKQYGLDKGFSRFDASVLDRGNPHEISTSKELTELALNDLKDLKEPFFVWIHYFDPHFAYLPHEAWTSFGNGEIDRYDQEIAFTDQHIGEVLNFLREKKLDQKTHVIFTADHGEEFGEHGGVYHETCYDEVLRVPLVIRTPGHAAGSTAALTEQIDLLPTVLGLLEIPVPPECPGRNLLPLDQPGGEKRSIFVERDRPPGYRQRAVISNPYKLIRIEPRDTTMIPPQSRDEYTEVENVHVGTYLYDLTADPGESRNLYAEGNPGALRLLALLAGHFTGAGTAGDTTVVDKEMEERLRSLGYIR